MPALYVIPGAGLPVPVYSMYGTGLANQVMISNNDFTASFRLFNSLTSGAALTAQSFLTIQSLPFNANKFSIYNIDYNLLYALNFNEPGFVITTNASLLNPYAVPILPHFLTDVYIGHSDLNRNIGTQLATTQDAELQELIRLETECKSIFFRRKAQFKENIPVQLEFAPKSPEGYLSLIHRVLYDQTDIQFFNNILLGFFSNLDATITAVELSGFILSITLYGKIL